MSGVVGDLASLKLSDVRRPSGLASLENMSMKHGIGAVLRTGGMRRMETNDSIEIIGDVIG